MNAFRVMQQRLKEEGWYVGWNEPCCQSCAWSCLPDYFDAQYDKDGYLIREDANGKRIEYVDLDYSKVLFNHSQDCEVYAEEDCEACEGEGYDEDDEDCTACNGTGMMFSEDMDIEEFDTSVEGFVCNSPEQQDGSLFCFDGSKKGVENLKTIIPIIEECGVSVGWDETGETRISLSW